MAGAGRLLCALALAALRLAGGAMDSCYDPQGRARRCLPPFENAAYGRQVRASNTCGSPAETYCFQMGTPDSSALCHRCDAADPRLHHPAASLTDFHSQEEPTWWQSQSMAFGVQHPASVNLTLHLGKSYEITYVRLRFHTSRPESFAIYKRSRADGPWIPYQFYSASCRKTYHKPQRQFLQPGEDEQVAFCTDEFSDISPLSGGNVAFSTLEGRPSAYSFDQSLVLQEWVTCTDLLISLDRLNTFGDDIFKDPKVLQSYYYAISDFSVGGRCKCNGHASECILDEEEQLTCLCQHNTTGVDCDMCQPFYQDRPWARGTAESANECLPCNCSGRSEECYYDWELYRQTGHGGHCVNCRDNTDGPHCERCQPSFYRWDVQMACQPCNCNPAGSLNLQCDDAGNCPCKATVTGWKCERCREGFHSLSEGGCRPCACNPAGSLGTCDSNSGHCRCKKKVEGYLCNRCQPGSFNLQPHNPVGCTSCFCYGHSAVCTSAAGYGPQDIVSDFSQGFDGWGAENSDGREMFLHWDGSTISVDQSEQEMPVFLAPGKFLGDQRFSYGQLLSVVFHFEDNTTDPFPAQLILEGNDISVSVKHDDPENRWNEIQCREQIVFFRLHEMEGAVSPALSAFQFQRLLSNLTGLQIRGQVGPGAGRMALKEVRLTSAHLGASQPALWVEKCVCPQGYQGPFCESCAPGYKREITGGGPFTRCVPCSCNQHGSCDPNTGICQCLDNTEGPSCERCTAGFYGNPFIGHTDDCKPCPCPGQSSCAAIPESREVICTQCPSGQRGRLCELCDDGFFGDPFGRNGSARPCRSCECSGNVDVNAVGNCDTLTGRCLRCLYNTAGEHCERCKEGFYGNPLATSPSAKCASCNCNPGGSAQGPEGCDPISGQCPCLSHVAGRRCSQCEEGYYDLQPGFGCKSCQCHPVGAQNGTCHPSTGQCICSPGVEGRSCNQCQAGYFGLSSGGCQACNCSKTGSVSLQCHDNSTCLCKKGFVGYKCDQCEVNYFLDPGSNQCQECPLCYSLVKKETEKLNAKLMEMEVWVQEPNCGRSRAEYYHVMLGETPRGDSLHYQHLLKGAKVAFLEKMDVLRASVGDVHSRLKNASGIVGCGSYGAAKMCGLLSEIQSILHSTHQEIQMAAETLGIMEFPAEMPPQFTNWSRQALEARELAHSHIEMAALVEDLVDRAALASQRSLRLLKNSTDGGDMVAFRRAVEESHQKIQRIQDELILAMEEATTLAEETFVPVSRTSSSLALRAPVRPLVDEARSLDQKVTEIDQLIEVKERLAGDGSVALQAELQGMKQRMQPLEELWQRTREAQVLAETSFTRGEAAVSEAKGWMANLDEIKRWAAHPKSRPAVNKKTVAAQDRVVAEAQRKVRQAQRLLGNSASVSAQASRTASERESVSRERAKAAEQQLWNTKHESRKSSKLSAQIALVGAEISRQEQNVEELRLQLVAPAQVTGEMDGLGQGIWDAHRSLEKDIAILNHLLSSLGDMGQSAQAEAALNLSRVQLENLEMRLVGTTRLSQMLDLLQEEAEHQRERMETLDQELEEIQSDKQNLEAILRTLPRGC